VVEEELKGKLSTQSSTSSFLTDVEQLRVELSQFVPLPLVECKYYRIRVVWFKSKANNIIYKCPNNHAV
jgi:hypothetical protein